MGLDLLLRLPQRPFPGLSLFFETVLWLPALPSYPFNVTSLHTVDIKAAVLLRLSLGNHKQHQQQQQELSGRLANIEENQTVLWKAFTSRIRNPFKQPLPRITHDSPLRLYQDALLCHSCRSLRGLRFELSR